MWSALKSNNKIKHSFILLVTCLLVTCNFITLQAQFVNDSTSSWNLLWDYPTVLQSVIPSCLSRSIRDNNSQVSYLLSAGDYSSSTRSTGTIPYCPVCRIITGYGSGRKSTGKRIFQYCPDGHAENYPARYD